MTRRAAGALATLLTAVVIVGCGHDETREYVPLWQVDGERNSIFLLASVHLLRPSDYPLPNALYVAYDEAEILVMELDMDDLDPAEGASLAAELGLIKNADTLATLLGDEHYRRAAALAEDASLPLEALGKSEPWLAAITLEQLMLKRIGFDPALGLENHFLDRAADDGKEIIGLETLREQLEKLDQLPAPVQRSLFMRTLEAGSDIGQVMDQLLDAWRSGNTGLLESLALNDMQQQPVLYRQLVVSRNQNWLTQLENFLQDDDDYLVLVGALHLVGADGVPALLERRGYRVRQLESGATP